MTRSAAQKSDHFGLWMLLVVVVATTAVFLWTRSSFQHNDPGLQTHIDELGQLHVLGITLGKTTLKEAELILQSKSDVALYIYPQEHPKAGLKLEAFFPAIADHTKVILRLNETTQTIRAIEERATIPHQYQNLVARMNLAPDDVTLLHNAIVTELTLIPNLILTADNLKARFGEPDRSQQLDGGITRYSFDTIGLQAEFSEDETPSLHFTNPAQQRLQH